MDSWALNFPKASSAMPTTEYRSAMAVTRSAIAVTRSETRRTMAVIPTPATLSATMAPTKAVTLDVDGQTVSVSNPDKMFFPEAGVTKLDLVRYYLSVADGAVRGVSDRPMALKRFPNGAGGDFFFQKRAPANLPALRPDGRAFVSVRPHRRRGGGLECCRAGLGREPRLRRPQPASGAGG